MSSQRDPELDELFEESQELRELAQFMRRRPHPAAHVEPSPHFRVVLKQRLMREAWERAAHPPLPWYRRVLAPQPLAWAGAAVGALLIVFAAFMFANTPGGTSSTVAVHSSLDGIQTASLVNPIPLSFTQPMNESSVQTAVKIVPATEVTYQWQDPQHLAITPVHNLAPNTQYVVTISTSAKTQNGQVLTQAAPVQFVTQPPSPSPSPSPTSHPTSTPSPLVATPHLVAPTGGPASRWSLDGTKLYIVGPGGQLQTWPVQGSGAASSIQPDGVTLIAIGPDGNLAYLRDGQITYGALTVPNVQALAIGFGQSGLVFATSSDVQTSDQHKLAGFSEQAAAVDFSPGGDRLVYRGASGSLHLVDLTAHPAKDQLIGPSTGMGEWSTDGRYAYQADAGVFVVDGTTGASSKILDFPGLAGLTWSRTGQMLLSTSSAVYLYTPGDVSGAKKLSDGTYGQPEWAPSGGYFSFRRGTDLWVARVLGAPTGAGSGPTSTIQDDAVNGFMTARKNGQVDQATAYLDASGLAAFGPGKLSLVYTDPTQPTLARYYVLLSQPNRVVVRLVLTRGTLQSAVDETLLLQATGGKVLIHGVTETARASFGVGPEIVRVVVTADQVQLFFDSDLDPGTVQGGVSVKGVSGLASYDAKAKAVTIPVTGLLTPGAPYDLLVGASLKDTPNGRQAVPYELQLVGA